jgi:gamma-glutamylcyclotransferase (GGCT)/AIG2-like uncharacterized protein YtfP
LPARSERRSRRPPPLLFAYGTLMRGYSRHRFLARRATALGEAFVTGDLLDLGSYPGLVAGAGRVRGELYRLDDEALLPVLDEEEGVYNFERRRTTVTPARGRSRRAWVYWYRGPRVRAVPIPYGDYRRAHPRP